MLRSLLWGGRQERGHKEVGVRCLDFVFVIVDRVAQLHNWGENKGHCSRDYALKKINYEKCCIQQLLIIL